MATITGTSGDDTLLAGGVGNDLIFGSGGHDTLFGDSGDDQLFGGTGNDSLDGYKGNDTLLGGAGEDTLVGGNGNDFLDGGSGNDELYGGANDDRLFGGLGNDTLDGGTGNDTITIDVSEDHDGGADVAVDEAHGDEDTDTLVLIGTVGGTGYAFVDLSAGDQIVFIGGPTEVNSQTGFENVDASGLGGFLRAFGNGTQNHIIGSSGDDFIRAYGSDDTILGGGGNDYINGGDEDDSIDGGTGDDLVDGGFGNDILTGGAGNDSIYGYVGDDTITWNLATGGIDKILAGPDIDTLKLEGAVAGDGVVIVDLSDPYDQVLSVGGAFEPVVQNGFENVDGSGLGSSMIVLGDPFGNVITGSNGNDVIFGDAGDDTLAGGLGQDTVVGGEDDDNITMLVSTGNVDELHGGSENDTLVLAGTAPGTGVVVVDLSAVDQIASIGGSAEGLEQTGFEHVDATGLTGRASITGDGGDNTLIGSAGNDTIDGGGGADFIDGAAGHDSLAGGTGQDTVLGGGGNDTITMLVTDPDQIDGGADTDTLKLTGVVPGNGIVHVNLGFVDQVVSIGGVADALVQKGFENLDASGLGSSLLAFGDDNPNVIIGSSGDDTIRGNLGTDTITGGAGNDQIIMLVTAGDRDVINAGTNGSDTLKLLGTVPGNGIVVVNLGSTTDQVTSIGGSSETLAQTGFENLDASGIGSAVNVQGSSVGNNIVGSDGNDTINSNGGDDTIVGGLGHDSINANGNNDSVSGGDGNDTINGGDGNDTISGDADNDSLIGGNGNDSIDGGAGVDTINGGSGNDTIAYDPADTTVAGGDGSGDWLILPNGSHTVNLSLSDQVTSSGGTATGFEHVDATAVAFPNAVSLTGNSSANMLLGGSGYDFISGGSGNDTLSGGAGSDTITGGSGTDSLSGGGADGFEDYFDFNATSETPVGSSHDVITDFEFAKDFIDVNTIDANTGLSGNQDFVFIGTAAFSAAGQIRAVSDGGGNTLVQGNVNSSLGADFEILLIGIVNPADITDANIIN